MTTIESFIIVTDENIDALFGDDTADTAESGLNTVAARATIKGIAGGKWAIVEEISSHIDNGDGKGATVDSDGFVRLFREEWRGRPKFFADAASAGRFIARFFAN